MCRTFFCGHYLLILGQERRISWGLWPTFLGTWTRWIPTLAAKVGEIAYVWLETGLMFF